MLKLEKATKKFCAAYRDANDALKECADIYARYVRQFDDGLDHRLEFQRAVQEYSNSEFVITGYMWSLLWYVGEGVVIPEFLLEFASHGLVMAVMGVPVDEQRRFMKEGADIYDDEDHVRHVTMRDVTRPDLEQLYTHGTRRNREEQLNFLASHTRKTRKGKRYNKADVRNWILTKRPFTPEELRQMAAELEG